MKILKRDEKKRKIYITFSFFKSQKLIYLHWVFRLKWNETQKKTKRNREEIFFVQKLVDGIYKMMERFFLHNNASGRAI
jgi:hypothetical protein